MAIAAITTGISLISSIGTRFTSPAQHEAVREAAANALYAKAVGGDTAALRGLYTGAGLDNPGGVTDFSAGSHGVATLEARRYYETKYNAALAILRQKNVDPSITGGTLPNTTDNLSVKASSLSLTQLALIGGGVFVAYKLIKKVG